MSSPAAGAEPPIYRFARVDSTNAKARELAQAGAEEQSVIVAVEQTAGRGSGSRTWSSPAGGLYTSFLLRAREAQRVTDLCILAGAAMAQTVRECTPKGREVSVKWPNDCLIDKKKVGGVLCEALGASVGHLCIVGIGINVNLSVEVLAPFQKNPFPATSLLLEGGGEGGLIEVEKILMVLRRKVFNLYRVYRESGFAEINLIWEKNCAMIGRELELQPAGGSPVKGMFLGIDDSGGLVLSNSQGERRSYFSGEVTCYW